MARLVALGDAHLGRTHLAHLRDEQGRNVREETLSSVLGEFARTLSTDFPVQGILDHFVKRIVEVLPVTSAGVTLISAGVAPRYVAASDDAALRQKTEERNGLGPFASFWNLA